MSSAQATVGFQKTYSILTGGIAGSYEYDHLHYLKGGRGNNIHKLPEESAFWRD